LEKGTNSHNNEDRRQWKNEKERERESKRQNEQGTGRSKNVTRGMGMLDKESGRKLVDGNCTQKAFRANILMHGNSLVEERDNDGADNGDSATSILDEATIFLAAGEEWKEKKSEKEASTTDAYACGEKSDAVDGRYSSISMSERVDRVETRFARPGVAKREFSEGGGEAGARQGEQICTCVLGCDG